MELTLEDIEKRVILKTSDIVRFDVVVVCKLSKV